MAAAAAAGVLSEDLSGRLRQGYALLTRLRLANQLHQLDAREYLTDSLDPHALPDAEQDGLRDAFRAIKSVQSVTSVAFRTDL